MKTVKGYIVGTSDTRSYEAATEADWWPSLRTRFPLSNSGDERTKADQEYIDLIHRSPDVALDSCLAVSPAHVHISQPTAGGSEARLGTEVNRMRCGASA